ncbi:MAG: hypothetical protein RIF32_24150 [Leptospirales bacterium]
MRSNSWPHARPGGDFARIERELSSAQFRSNHDRSDRPPEPPPSGQAREQASLPLAYPSYPSAARPPVFWRTFRRTF